MCLFCWTQRKIFWRKFVTRLFWGTIDFHSRRNKILWPRTALFPTFFRISSFVFGRTNTFIQVWNYLRVSKWWQNFTIPLRQPASAEFWVFSTYFLGGFWVFSTFCCINLKQQVEKTQKSAKAGFLKLFKFAQLFFFQCTLMFQITFEKIKCQNMSKILFHCHSE